MSWHLNPSYGHVTMVSDTLFDSCQLTKIWMSIIELNTGNRFPH